ncbi:MAG TPA: PLP-dependent aminotransferase family protein [Thermoanaerobaculia bacterium]|nr:PLP-dependent aminotransferase family protein [Thermoanaerobaculia bacterium]
MRRTRGALLPPLATGRVRRRDLYRAIRAAVLEGVLSPGERLPSSRQAAADYGVSRGMVEEVFGQLTEEGFLDRAVGRGTVVAARVARLIGPVKRERGRRQSTQASRRGAEVAANAACREPQSALPFNAGIADTSEFPWKIWQRLQTRAARELGPAALNFSNPRGLPALRAAIARYLAQFRGIRCTAGQVIVFSSAQQALYALSVLLLDRGDAVWLEDPSYLGARAAFELAGAAITPVPVDDEGIRVDVGRRRAPRARLAYVTPPHQYPTGVALSLERRIALLEWAAHNDSWVVEDDYDGEFRYAGQPLTPLYSLDSHARVLYLGTLNKSMFVSLRLAYAVVPEEIVEPLANVRTQLDGFTPAFPQMTMSLFMDEGYFSSHLRLMRAVYGAKRAALVEGLAPLAKRGWTWSSNPAGMHLLVRHDAGDHVRAIAAASSLDLALLSAYRAAPARDDGLFLRFGGLDMASLRAGAAALASLRVNDRRNRSEGNN